LSTNPLRLRELLQRLVEADIRFILVGGLAVNRPSCERATGPSSAPSLVKSTFFKAFRTRDHDDIQALEAAQEDDGSGD